MTAGHAYHHQASLREHYFGGGQTAPDGEDRPPRGRRSHRARRVWADRVGAAP